MEDDSKTLDKDGSIITIFEKKESFDHVVTSGFCKDGWLVLGASVIGRAHVTAIPSIPCQDAHEICNFENGWGISVVCDGAGSAKNSALGSKSVCRFAIDLYSELLEEKKWDKQNLLPSEEEWKNESSKILSQIAKELISTADQQAVELNSLACTIIVLIFSKEGILISHIGDGRAGYCDEFKNWHPLMTPYKGEEANQTVFITSNIWNSPDSFIESRLINSRPLAFTLMTDGCETHTFQTGWFDEVNQKFVEQNDPYPGFFNPLLETLCSAPEDSLSELKEAWGVFVDRNSLRMQNEPDDKTLLIGVLKK